MKRGLRVLVWSCLVAGLGSCGSVDDLGLDATEPAEEASLQFEDAAHHCGSYVLPSPSPVGTCVATNAVVRHYTNTMFTGTVDVTACVARISAGQKLPYHHDGTIFRNAEGRLPAAPAGFYREYVDPTPGLGGPGPQRLVWGGQRLWYYTPDHYETFIPVICN